MSPGGAADGNLSGHWPGESGENDDSGGEMTAVRRPAWGADSPADAEGATARIRAAASRCYDRKGPQRTTVTDIAREAGIHRTTVYSYYPTREAILVACFAAEVEQMLTEVMPEFTGRGDFLGDLVRAAIRGLAYCRASPVIEPFVLGDELGYTMATVSASEEWRERMVHWLGALIVDAQQRGEVRDDVPSDEITRWIARVCFSLVGAPESKDRGGDESVLRDFMVASLRPLGPAHRQ